MSRKNNLHFDLKEVEELVTLTMSQNPGHVPYTGGSWGRPEQLKRGLQLVGDHGVYLMSNAPEQQKQPNGRYRVAYAEGCDPDKDEDFYENKRELFGGDDGVEFLDMPSVLRWLENGKQVKARRLTLALSSNNLELIMHIPKESKHEHQHQTKAKKTDQGGKTKVKTNAGSKASGR